MPTVQSNKEYVVSSANDISSSVKSSSVTDGVAKTAFGGSTSCCPSLEPSIVETFLGCCKELFSRINSDTANIAKVGDGFATMDNSMAGVATTLNMEVKSNLYAVGDVDLGDAKATDSLSNADVRKRIQAILTEKGSDFKLDERDGSGDDDKKGEDDDDDGSYGSYGGYSGGSSGGDDKPPAQTTEAPTVPQTEVATEIKTEIQTEVVTEVATEAVTEVITEAPTEIKTEAQTTPQPAKTENKPSRQPSWSSKSDNYVETPTVPVEVPTVIDEPIIEDEIFEEEPIIEEPVIDEEIIPEIDLDDFEEPEVVDIPVTPEPVEKTGGSGVGAAVAILGATAAVAGAGIAANKYIQKKKEEDGEDWGGEV